MSEGIEANYNVTIYEIRETPQKEGLKRAERAGFEPAVRVNAHTLSKRASLGCFTEKRPLLQMAPCPAKRCPVHHFQPVLRMMGSVLPTSQAECYSTAQLWQC